MANPSDILSSPINNIYFYSISTNYDFYFKAFITEYNDQYTSNWNSQEIYGRMDPIYTYKNTVRKISLGFDVPNYGIEESLENSKKIDQFIQSMYPVYTQDGASGGTALISTPPLFKIKFSNLIMNAVKEGTLSISAKDDGLLGWIDGFNFKPELESGFFPLARANTTEEEESFLFPKLFKISFNFNVIHEHALGTLGGEKLPRLTIKNLPSFSHYYMNYALDGTVEQSTPETNPAADSVSSAKNAVEEATSQNALANALASSGEQQSKPR